MVVSKIMTRGVKTVAPGATLRKAVRIMAVEDCGVLPVAQDEQLTGMLTDRDITVRAVARGKNPDECAVDEAMTRDALYKKFWSGKPGSNSRPHPWQDCVADRLIHWFTKQFLIIIGRSTTRKALNRVQSEHVNSSAVRLQQ
jgi:CBS domain-containing protein